MSQRASRRTVCCSHCAGMGCAWTSRCCRFLKLTDSKREFSEVCGRWAVSWKHSLDQTEECGRQRSRQLTVCFTALSQSCACWKLTMMRTRTHEPMCDSQEACETWTLVSLKAIKLNKRTVYLQPVCGASMSCLFSRVLLIMINLFCHRTWGKDETIWRWATIF